jgi:hypothetical protein
MDAAGRQVLVESPLWRFAAHRGLTTLHAAGVVIGDVTLVLRGPAGAGKSTLAAAAAIAGHGVLAEEGVWYDPGQAPACLRGAPWTIHLDDASLALLGREAPPQGSGLATGAASAPMKRALDVADDLHGRAAERAPLGPIVYLDPPDGSSARWRRLAPGEARVQHEAMKTVGESTQDPSRWAAARDALIARGAYSLAGGQVQDRVSALEAIAADAGPPAEDAGVAGRPP